MTLELAVAIDFDGTVVKHAYPGIGEDVPHVVRVLTWMNDKGTKLILNTMRCDAPNALLFTEALKWFEYRNIKLWAAQKHPLQHHWTTSSKCLANLYIDDCGLGMPLIYEKCGPPYVDWLKVENILKKHEFFKNN